MEICTETLKSEIPLEDFKSNGTLFYNEAARNAVTKFQKFDPCSQNELSVLALVWFYAVLTDDFDVLQMGIATNEAISLLDFSADYSER